MASVVDIRPQQRVTLGDTLTRLAQLLPALQSMKRANELLPYQKQEIQNQNAYRTLMGQQALQNASNPDYHYLPSNAGYVAVDKYGQVVPLKNAQGQPLMPHTNNSLTNLLAGAMGVVNPQIASHLGSDANGNFKISPLSLTGRSKQAATYSQNGTVRQGQTTANKTQTQKQLTAESALPYALSDLSNTAAPTSGYFSPIKVGWNQLLSYIGDKNATKNIGNLSVAPLKMVNIAELANRAGGLSQTSAESNKQLLEPLNRAYQTDSPNAYRSGLNNLTNYYQKVANIEAQKALQGFPVQAIPGKNYGFGMGVLRPRTTPQNMQQQQMQSRPIPGKSAQEPVQSRSQLQQQPSYIPRFNTQSEFSAWYKSQPLSVRQKLLADAHKMGT